jgi:DNA-binding SARP family transcriptional activator
MDGVRLELLGPPEILCNGRVVTGAGRKAVGLLAYLAAAKGRFHNRDVLAGLLWTDRFDEQARQSLRQLLSTLRKSIGDAIVTNEQGVAFAADKVGSDVEEFEALSASSDVIALQRASGLYRGEFLEGFQRISPAFDEWMQAERRRLRDKLLDVIETVARRQFAEGDRDQALATARRLVAEEPAHEIGHRIIMQALAQQGHRAAALRQFEHCKAALKRHLDAAPEAETLELAERIRAAPEAAQPIAQTAASPAAALSLVSRALRRRPVRRLVFSGAAVIVALSAGVVFLALRPTAPPASQTLLCGSAAAPAFQTPAVVVLPFETEAAGGEAAGFADALTDRIGATFTAVPRLSVVTGPPRGHPDLSRPRRDLAAALGVSHVLDGAVRAEGRELSVNIRLIDGESGEVLWSMLRSYDLRALNRLSARDEIALEVVRAAQRVLTEGDQALHFHLYETTSLSVLERVLAGSEHLAGLSRGNNMRARAEFAAALGIDSSDPPANTGMALTYAADVLFGWSDAPESDLQRAERHVAAALRSDPDYFYAHSVLGMIALLSGDHAAAIAHGEEALRLSGSGADAVALHALTLSYTNESARSLELAQRAMRLRPYAAPEWYHWILARASRLNGDPRTTLACLPPSQLQESGATAALVERALALSETGDAQGARALMIAASRQAPFTAESFCARPPYANEALRQSCIAGMVRAGAPRGGGD